MFDCLSEGTKDRSHWGVITVFFECFSRLLLFVMIFSTTAGIQQVSRDSEDKLTLSDLLIMPVQRIPRYVLILRVSNQMVAAHDNEEREGLPH